MSIRIPHGALRAAVPMLVAASFLAACPNIEDPPDPADEQEVITTVILAFTPQGGGAAVTATHADPENDGDPVIDPITLSAQTSYTLTVRFQNELEDPAEEITDEVRDEAAEHQVFIYGTGVQGPATGANAAHLVELSYADEDEGGLPVGLAHTVDAVSTGDAELKVLLRHLPEEDGAPTKTDGLAEDFAAGGSAAIPGDTDADVTFPLSVE